MSQYGKIEYWEDRYNKEQDPFDWYQRYSRLKEFLFPVEDPLINAESKILNIGCGNSKLSEEMFDEGFQNITSIDFSQNVIKQMQEKYQDKGPNFRYMAMDVKNMKFEDESFDFIIDKGTLDCVLCAENSTVNIEKMIDQVYKILKGGGVYFVVSNGGPDNRMNFLKNSKLDWEITPNQIQKHALANSMQMQEGQPDQVNVHYIYVCKKPQKQGVEVEKSQKE